MSVCMSVISNAPILLALLLQLLFDGLQVLLLRPHDCAWTAQAMPSSGLSDSVTKVLDHVRDNVGARAAQACFAMHRDGSGFRLAQLEERLQDCLGRVPSIFIEKVHVLDPTTLKHCLVVALVVEPHHAADSELLEDGNVFFGKQRRDSRAQRATLGERSRTGDELARHDPRNVAVFELRQLFERGGVEGGVVEVSQGDGFAHSPDTVCRGGREGGREELAAIS